MTRNEIALQVQENGPMTVELVKGEGYWYWTVTQVLDGRVIFYETETEYVMYLGDMEPREWVARGRAFLAECEERFIEMLEPSFGRLTA